MEQSSSKDKETTIRHQFDNFCRKILIGEASNYRKELARRSRHEITFSELSEAELERFYVMDEYSTDYYLFQVMGYDIKVKDALIGEALEALSEKNVISSFCLTLWICQMRKSVNCCILSVLLSIAIGQAHYTK